MTVSTAVTSAVRDGSAAITSIVWDGYVNLPERPGPPRAGPGQRAVVMRHS